MLYDKNTFTHILCTYFTIYQFENKELFLKNCFFWLAPGGYLILHLVDIHRFDTIIPVGKPKSVLSPQKYTKNRILETYVDFIDFDYHSKYVFPEKTNTTYLLETFTDKKTQHVRQNEQKLYLESKETILHLAKDSGYILHSQINYETAIGDAYQYLIILERPS
jgi:hypothetical protein